MPASTVESRLPRKKGINLLRPGNRSMSKVCLLYTSSEHIDVLRLRTLPVKAVQCLGGDGVRPGNQFIDLPDKLFFLYILSPSVHKMCIRDRDSWIAECGLSKP